MSQHNDQNKPAYTLVDYWMVLYRQRGIILLVAICAAAFSGWASTWITPRYEAVTIFYLPVDVSQAGGGISQQLRLPHGSRERSQAISAPLDFTEAQIAIYKRFPEKPLNELGSDVDIVVARWGIIRIHVRDTDPELAASVANGYVDYFNEFHQDLLKSDTRRTMEKIKKELVTVREKIDRTIQKQKELQDRHHIAVLATRLQALETHRSGLDTSLEQANVALIANTHRMASLREQLEKESEAYETGDIIIQSGVIGLLEQTMIQAEVDIATRQSELRDEHPDMVSLNRRYGKAKENLAREVARVVASKSKLGDAIYQGLRHDLIRVHVTRSELQARVKGLEAALHETNQKIDKLTGISVTLSNYGVEVKTLYATKARLEGSHDGMLTQSLGTKKTGLIIQQATPPSSPVFPILPLNMSIAGLGGLVVGVFYALFLDYLKNKKRVTPVPSLDEDQWPIALDEGFIEGGDDT